MRPELHKNINPEDFLRFYWLKEELAAFCKDYNIPRSGSKKELTERIYHFLKTGIITGGVKKAGTPKSYKSIQLSLEAKIPEGYKNDELHRAFFKSVIGNHFKFNVPFMNWMKENAGKTYKEAVAEWKRIIDEKKEGKKTEISPQFEYNQYTRDFFAANPHRTREDAIKCWKYKKSLPGHNKYEKSDLAALRSD